MKHVSTAESIRRISGMFGIAGWQWATLVALGLMFAMSEGIGIGMLAPVLAFAEDGAISTEGLGGVPARIVMALGLPVSLGAILALAFIPILARSLFLYGYQVFAGRIRFHAIARLRRQGWDAFMNASLPFVGAESHGRLVSVLTTEVDRAASAIPLLLQFIENAVLLTVYVAILVVVAPWLLPVVFALIGVITAVVRVKMRQSARFRNPRCPPRAGTSRSAPRRSLLPSCPQVPVSFSIKISKELKILLPFSKDNFGESPEITTIYS